MALSLFGVALTDALCGCAQQQLMTQTGGFFLGCTWKICRIWLGGPHQRACRNRGGRNRDLWKYYCRRKQAQQSNGSGATSSASGRKGYHGMGSPKGGKLRGAPKASDALTHEGEVSHQARSQYNAFVLCSGKHSRRQSSFARSLACSLRVRHDAAPPLKVLQKY